MSPRIPIEQRTKVVFFGTPEFACPTLNMLIDNQDVFEIVGVVTQPDRPAGRDLEVQRSSVKELAENYLLTLGKIAKKFIVASPENVNSPENVHWLESLGADVAVVVAYGQILNAQVLKSFRTGAVNVHASLLPRWRGAAPIPWALLSQDSVTGVTLQKIAQKLDSGDIIGNTQLVIDDTWDAPKLYSELSRRGGELVRRHLQDYVAGKLKLTPQDETLVTVAPKIKKEQGKIDWNQHGNLICAKIRALTPWPGTWTTREGKVLKILRANYIEYNGGAPGDLVGLDKINFWVQCGENTALQISVVQAESRSRMPVAEYIKGQPFKKGDKLGT